MEQLNFFEKMEEVENIICPVCGNSFEKTRRWQKFCSISCRQITSSIKYRQENKEKIKEKSKKYRIRCKNTVIKKWYEKNKEKHKETQKKWYEKNKEKLKEFRKKYRDENKDKRKQYDKEYGGKNRERINERRRKREKTNNIARLRRVLRHRIYDSIKKNYSIKAYKTQELLGCTVLEVRKHLEKQFKEGMSWENYGHKTWHIDHIIPCASFDLTDPEQQKKCFHYTNLQPLWASENLSKGSKILLN